MAVKFNSSGGGSVLLDAPSTASNLTVTLPSASGTLVSTGSPFSGGTANGVVYLNGSSVPTTGSALTFDGTTVGIQLSARALNIGTTSAANFYTAYRYNSSDIGYIGNGPSVITAGSSATDLAIGTATTNPLVFGINSAEQMRLTSTGLGIGTSSPGAKLDVQAATSSILNTSTTGTNYVRFNQTNSGGILSLGIDNSAGSGIFGVGAYAAGLWYSGNYPLVFATNNTERMRINSSGNLGLGVTPSAVVSDFKGIEVGSPGNGVFGGTGNYSHIILSDNAYPSAGSVACSYGFSGYAGQYRINSGYHYWLSAPSGTAGGAITFTTILTGTKDQTLALQGASSVAGTGITFPATQSASSDANTLDDYEEGTWTPTVNSGTIAVGNNWYIKVGRLVTVNASITTFSDRSTASQILISGFPYAGTSGRATGFAVGMYRFTGSVPAGYFDGGSSTLYMYVSATAGGYGTLNYSSLNNAAVEMYINFTYEASA